jgi:hypothetical protein
VRIFSESNDLERDERSQWLSGRTTFCVKV